jgi:hypothetical protein
MDRIIGYLQKEHKLVKEGYYIGSMTAIGSGPGVALGAARDRFSFVSFLP